MTEPPRLSSTHQFARPTRPVLRSLYTRPSIDWIPVDAGTKIAQADGGGGGGGSTGGGCTGGGCTGGGCTGGGAGGVGATGEHPVRSRPFLSSGFPLFSHDLGERFASAVAHLPASAAEVAACPRFWDTPTMNGVATKATSTAKARISLLAR